MTHDIHIRSLCKDLGDVTIEPVIENALGEQEVTSGLPFVSLQVGQVNAMLEKLGVSFSTDDTAKEPASTIVQNHH